MKYKAYLSAILAAILLVTMTACGSAVASRPYDYYIDCTTREQLAALADEDFVEDIFSFSLMQFSLPDNSAGNVSFGRMEHFNMKIIMRWVSMIFYPENRRYGNAVRRCLLD